MRIEKCPECGSRQLTEGKISHATIYASLWKSCTMEALVCSNCGRVLELRATKPELFAPKIR